MRTTTEMSVSAIPLAGRKLEYWYQVNTQSMPGTGHSAMSKCIASEGLLVFEFNVDNETTKPNIRFRPGQALLRTYIYRSL